MSHAGSGTVAVRSVNRVLALVNPEAGRGDVERIKNGILLGAEECGATVDFAIIGPNDSATEIARSSGGRYDLVLVAGGDGTVAQTVAGLVGQAVPMGIVPAGTGNIVAANLAVPASPKDATRAAILGTPSPYDVGRTDDGRIFVLAAGAGYDADLIRDADRELKRRFGPLAYLFAVVKNLRVKRARFTIELDGLEKLHVHAKTVLVCNVGRTMGSLPLAPDANVQDGWLDVVVFKFQGFGQLLLLFLMAVIGRLRQDPRVQFHRARRVKISASRPMPLQVDGEFIDRTTPIEMSVVPAAVNVVWPPPKPILDLGILAETALKALLDIPQRKPGDPQASAARPAR